MFIKVGKKWIPIIARIISRSDLKLGEFKFLDCKHVHRSTDLQARLSEQVFVHNNTLGPGIGYTPHQLVLGMSSGVPGIYKVPETGGYV